MECLLSAVVKNQHSKFLSVHGNLPLELHPDRSKLTDEEFGQSLRIQIDEIQGHSHNNSSGKSSDEYENIEFHHQEGNQNEGKITTSSCPSSLFNSSSPFGLGGSPLGFVGPTFGNANSVSSGINLKMGEKQLMQIGSSLYRNGLSIKKHDSPTIIEHGLDQDTGTP